MYRSNIYPKMILLVSFFVLAFSSVFAQTPSMELKLQLIGPNEWGVYVRPNGVHPSTNQTITVGGDQVTVVMPLNYGYTNFTTVNGIWSPNAPVHGPSENPTKSYISFGLQSEIVPIPYTFGQETLLFTFKGDGLCPDELYLIDNDTDPFNVLPNSVNSNPGNEYAVFDMVTFANYSYLGNYSPYAWDCHDCDGDGILNAFEDSDGDGIYEPFNEDLNGNGTLDYNEDANSNGILDPGEDIDGDGILDLVDEDADGDGYLDPDVSQICNPCDPYHPESAAIELIGGADVICAGDVGDTAYFRVIIEGGWPPYTVHYTDGATNFTDTLYYSGDSIPFVPTSTVTLDLINIVDSFNCLLDTSLSAGLVISVHGPISFTDEPDPVTECYGNGTQFCVATQNLGDGYTYKKWQVSTNNGSTWADIQDGGVYDNTDSLCMDIANVANKHNYQYRCKIFTDVCDTIYSTAALLQVEGPISISLQPRDTVNCATEGVAFTASSANGGLVGTMSYVWQYSTNGTTYYDLANGAGGAGGATYGGTTASSATATGSSTLTVDNIQVGQDGWYFRMKVSTGTCDTVFTLPARLNVSGPITVIRDPVDYTNCAGNEVFFIADYSNAGYLYPADSTLTTTNYIWQVSTNNGVTWSNITNTGVYNGITGIGDGGYGSDTLAITNVVGLNGNRYRICYTSPTCSVPVYSASALLNVSGNVAFSLDPKDITVCSGGDTIFTATASIPQGTFTFGWDYSDDNGLTWDSINFTTMSALFSHTQTTAISSGTDVLTVSNVAGMYGRRFRARADATACNSIYSNYAILSVEGPLSESVPPISVTECSGNPTSFTGGFNNPGVQGSTIYRWEISFNSGATWVPLNSGGIYAGVFSNQLTILNVAGLHNFMYRLSARTSTCNIQYGTAATLTVEGPILVTLQPSTVDLCSGDGTSFTSTADVGTAGTLVYQWQVTSDNTNWSDIDGTTDGGVYSGYDGTTLDVSNVANLYSRCYRLAFSTGECNRVYSDAACMNIDGPISITAHPDDIIQCSGEAVIFGAKAATASLEADSLTQIQYQWQESSDDTLTWHVITNDTLYNGAQTDTMSISYTTGLDGNYYRLAIWTENCDTIYSYAALLDIEGPMTVTDEPDNITECSGSGVTFSATVSLENGDPGTLIYQWEVSQYDTIAGTWSPYINVVDGGVFHNATTTVLTIDDVADMYNWRFRLRYRTPNCNAQWSNYAQLTVEGPIGFETTGNPDDVTTCSGSSAVFCVETTNNSTAQIKYQWQVLTAGLDSTVALNWINLNNGTFYNGTKTPCLSVSNVAGFNGYRYRVLIETSTCSSAASYSALLTVEGPISFTDHPDEITQCSGEGVTFSAVSEIAVGNAGTMTYQWQISDDATCTSYTNIDGVIYPANSMTGFDTPTLSIGDVAGLNGRCFRLAVKTGVCNNVYSFPAKLYVEGPLTITTNPVDYTNCSDKEAYFFSKIFNPAVGGADAVQNQWQLSSDGGTTWLDITQLIDTVGGHIVNFSGYDSDTLFISPLDGLNSYMFRNIFWTETCNHDTTTAAMLNVEGPITFADQPDDVTLCSASSTQFTVAIANSTGVGVVQYVWQRFQGGAWVDLTNSAPYSGAFTNQLSISNVANLNLSKYRCKVKTGNCEWSYSDLANLFVEGPITITLDLPDTAYICSNRPYLFNTTITNPGYGQMTYRWQYSSNNGTTWVPFTSNIGDLSSIGVVNPTDPQAKWQSAYGQDLNLTNTDGLNGYMFRLAITTAHCSNFTNDIVLIVRDKCLSGLCDLDNDGLINDVDPDDDNDQLSDFWEQWMTDNNIQVATDTFIGTGPWNYTVAGAGFPYPTSPYISYDRCLVDTDGDGIYDNQEDPDGDNINNGEETDADGIFEGNPLDPCSPVLGPTCIGINLAIKVGLQGAHIGVTPTDPISRATLRDYGITHQQLIPGQEPYEAIPAFTHNGPDGGGYEHLTGQDSIDMFAVNDNDAIVDWVFVELRSSTALDSVATTRAGLLQRDGDVVDLDGGNLRFPLAAANTYYVSVRHRNHLGVMTNEALDLSPALQEIDFTDPSFPVNGTYPQVQIGDKMYMWAGDLNSDGRTVYQGPGNDVLKLFTTVLYDPLNTSLLANFISQGYLVADVNLDGRAIYQGPLNDRSMLLLNTILSHPANVNLISNFVILEMLP
ncbi:MAG: hypothetical protein GC192_20620 [Bacteroidetes bacterium]|nr:hypothetical protein [Bacteroidota bacterium]